LAARFGDGDGAVEGDGRGGVKVVESAQNVHADGVGVSDAAEGLGAAGGEAVDGLGGFR